MKRTHRSPFRDALLRVAAGILAIISLTARADARSADTSLETPCANFAQVSPGFYRGAEPGAPCLEHLATLGVTTIVNLPWLGWSLVLIFPSAVLASTTVLPTTPSGALWLFSAVMLVCGSFVATGRAHRLAAGGRRPAPAGQ